tara:strand:- start:567 stop:1502 length:936 start_codon:yes stop_codon:yes gene_type:complete
MIKNIFKFIFIFFFLILHEAESKEVKIKYIVENNIITNIDIENEINYLLLVNNKLSELNKELLVEYSIKSLLKEKIKEIELRKNFLFNQNNEIVNNQIEIFKGNLGIKSETEFNDVLLRLNLDRKLLFHKIEIEVLWNKLIYEKFIDQVIVNQNQIENDLKMKISNSKDEIKEYLIHEILFTAKTTQELNNLYSEINKKINEIGFENTASLLSISETSKFGGKIGWLNENQLSKQIIDKIKNLENLKPSDPIKTPNGILILMVKDTRQIKKKISFEDELQRMINKEAESQLTQFSQIFFKKLELNTKIYEK